MQFQEEFSLPPTLDSIEPIPDSVAKDKAFYGAATTAEPNKLIESFQDMYRDFQTQGESAAYDAANVRWKQEQDVQVKSTVAAILNDPNVSNEDKKGVLNLYASSGIIPSSLKDKYRAVTSATFVDQTQSGIQDQISAADTAIEKTAKLEQEQAEDNLETSSEFLNYLQASGLTVADVVASIPASVYASINAIFAVDPVKGAEAFNDAFSTLSLESSSPEVQVARENILKKLEFLEIPYQAGYDFTIKRGLLGTGIGKDDPDFAIIGGLGTELVTSLGALSLYRVLKPSIRRGIPKTKPDSPVRRTHAANPEAGAKIATAAAQDPELAQSLGTDQGTIIAESLPRPFGKEEKGHVPSIDEDLQREFNDLDSEVSSVIVEAQFDPTLHNVALRQRELDSVLKITREKREGAVYMPSLSSIMPSITDIWEGIATFGKNKHYFFNSRTEAIDAYNTVLKNIEDSPKELSNNVAIVDRLTGERFTPEQLLADTKYWNKDEIIGQIPKEYEGIPIKVGTVTDESGVAVLNKNGKPAKGRLWRNSKGKPTSIVIDVDAIKKDYVTLNKENKAKFESPNEFVRFVLEHEIAHAKLDRTPEMSDLDYEKAVNNIALDALKKAKAVTTAPKQFAIEWNWKRQYDDLKDAVFGKDAVKAKILGIDVSGLARGSLSEWIFGGRGIFPRWFERATARLAPRSARLVMPIMETIKTKIATTKTPKELSDLVNYVEEIGVDELTYAQLQKRYPYLSEKLLKDLQITHAYWRRVNYYNWLLLNFQNKIKIQQEGFTKGLFINDKYETAANPDIQFLDRAPPKEVWDFDLNTKVEFQLDRRRDGKEGAFDLGGKQLVALRKPFSVGDEKYHYALINGGSSRLGLLPDRTVPRIPGYSPVKYKAFWYVDIIPTSLKIDGVLVTDPNTLRTYKQTVAAAYTEKEGLALQKEFVANNRDKIVNLRLERQVNFNRVMQDQELHEELLRHAMERNTRLKGANGEAPIEDRLQSLLNATQNIMRQGTMIAWEQATKKAFVDSYGVFLKDNEFPALKSDIQPLPDMTKEEFKLFEEALTVFDHYAKIKSFGTWGDGRWSDVFNKVADVFENFKWTSKLAPLSRELAAQGNIVAEYPRMLASMLFINLNPIRQWFIQPAQLYEMWAIEPVNGVRRLAELGAFRLALASDAPVLKNTGKVYYEAAKKSLYYMDSKEFDDIVAGLRQSGILESVDMNMLVHGVFDNADRGLVETNWEAAFNNITSPVKKINRAGRSVGFDFAELNNRIGLWLIARERWIKNNPDKDPTTKEAIEDISFDEWNLSGAMTSAGSYPYQRGALSVFMQFAAITQKLTMNLIQSNTSPLTAADKAKLVAARAVLYGAQYGLPFGAVAYHYIDQSDNETVREYGHILKRGLYDRLMNRFLMALTGVETSPDVMTGSVFGSYGESTTGVPYYEFAHELFNIFEDGQTVRFPATGAISSLFDAIGRVRSYWVAKEALDIPAWKLTFLEGLKLASGFNNIGKASYMYATGDLLTKKGNHLELNATVATAVAQTIGFQPWITHDQFNAIGRGTVDRNKAIEEDAENIHQWMVNLGKEVDVKDYDSHLKLLQSWVTMMQESGYRTPEEINTIMQRVNQKQKQANKGTQSSILINVINNISAENDKELQVQINFLRSYYKDDPAVSELLDIYEGKGNP